MVVRILRRVLLLVLGLVLGLLLVLLLLRQAMANVRVVDCRLRHVSVAIYCRRVLSLRSLAHARAAPVVISGGGPRAHLGLWCVSPRDEVHAVDRW